MEHTSLVITIDLVENTDVEHPVVDDQEEKSPFDKGPIQTFDSFLDEGGFIMEIACGEEIACCDEEQGHVEFEDKLTEPAGRLCMGNDHQNNGDALRNRNRGVAGYSHGCNNDPNHPRNFCHPVRK